MEDSQVKVYLTKADGTVVLAPTLVSDLSAATGRENTKVLATAQDVYTGAEEAKTTGYVLRMWVDENVTVDSTSTATYRALVNVDSTVNPVQ